MASNSIIPLFFYLDEVALLSMNIPFFDGEEDGSDYKIANLLKDNNDSYVLFISLFLVFQKIRKFQHYIPINK